MNEGRKMNGKNKNKKFLLWEYLRWSSETKKKRFCFMDDNNSMVLHFHPLQILLIKIFRTEKYKKYNKNENLFLFLIIFEYF